MKDPTNTPKKTPAKPVDRPTDVVDQLIEIADWTSRHPKDTAEQKRAVAVKELLEQHRQELQAA